jgi:hypothetical protein
MSVAVVLNFAGAHSLYGLDTELAKLLGVDKKEVFTGTSEFPFAWFYCDDKAAARAQRVLTPSTTFPLHSLTVLERASVAAVVAALEQPPPTSAEQPLPTWGGWGNQGNLGSGDASHAYARAPAPAPAPAPGGAAAATPSSRRFWACTCRWVNEPNLTQCRKCDSPRTAEAQEAPPNWVYGDWDCPNCSTNNFARRFNCIRCRIDKPEGATVTARQPPQAAMLPPPLPLPPPPPLPLPFFNSWPQATTQLPVPPWAPSSEQGGHGLAPLVASQRLPVPKIVNDARIATRRTTNGALPCFTGPLKQQGTFLAQVHLLPLREAGAADLDLAGLPWPEFGVGLDIKEKVKETELMTGKKGAVASSRAALVLCAAAEEAGVKVLAAQAAKLQKDSRVGVIKLTKMYELLLMPISEQALRFWQLTAAAWTQATQNVPGTVLLGAVVPRPVTLTLQLSAGNGRPGEQVLSIACWTRPTSVQNHALQLPTTVNALRADGGAFPAESALEEASFVVTPKLPPDIAALTAALTVPASTAAGGALLQAKFDGDALWLWPDPSGGPHLLALAHLFGLEHKLLEMPSPFEQTLR